MMIYWRKEFSYVTLQNPDSLCIIARCFAGESSKSVYDFVRTFGHSARERIRYECLVKEWIQLPVNRVVKQAVSDFGFMDIPRFGIRNFEILVGWMFIGFLGQIAVKWDDVTHEIAFKFLNITLFALASDKFFPSSKQIFHRDDIIICMTELNSSLALKSPPPNRILPVLNNIKDSYLLWHGYFLILPKIHRYSFGIKIDSLFIELIEAVSAASFLRLDQKIPYVQLGIRKLDTLKVLLMILWETKSIDNKKYIAISIKIDEIGRMLGGWVDQLIKQNSPAVRTGEK